MAHAGLFRLATLTLLALLATPVAALAQAPATQPDPFRTGFDELDARARAAIQQIRCTGLLTSLVVQGSFGPADSLGSAGHCTSAGERALGVILEPDSGLGRAIRISAVDLMTEERVQVPLDTARLLARTRATVDALQRGATRFQAAGRSYATVTLDGPRGSIEVWLLPEAILGGSESTAVGGELGYFYAADGVTLTREVNAFDSYRPVVLSDTVETVIAHHDLDVPPLSTMIFASLLAEAGEVVTIETRTRRSILAGAGVEGVWMHMRRGGAP